MEGRPLAGRKPLGNKPMTVAERQATYPGRVTARDESRRLKIGGRSLSLSQALFF